MIMNFFATGHATTIVSNLQILCIMPKQDQTSPKGHFPVKPYCSARLLQKFLSFKSMSRHELFVIGVRCNGFPPLSLDLTKRHVIK